MDVSSFCRPVPMSEFHCEVLLIVLIESGARRAPGFIGRHRQPDSGASPNPVPLDDSASGQTLDFDPRAPNAEHGALSRRHEHIVVGDVGALGSGAYRTALETNARSVRIRHTDEVMSNQIRPRTRA